MPATRPAPSPAPALISTVLLATSCSPSMSRSPVAAPAVRVQALCCQNSRVPPTAAVGGQGMTALKILGMAALAAAVLLSSRPSEAQDSWPNRPVKVVVPFGAGGAADRLGR